MQRTPHFGAAIAGWLLLLCSTGCGTLQHTTAAALDAFNPAPGPAPIAASSAVVLPADEVDRRLAFVQERLDRGRRHATFWQYGWLLVNAGGMTAASVQAAGSSGDDQAYAIIGASKGAIGTVYLLAQPLPGRSGAEPIRAMPADTEADRAAQLVAAEELLYAAAARSEQRASWPMHAGNVAINLIGGIILLARGDAGLAALSFGVDAAVGEVQIWTQPWRPRRDWTEYHAWLATGATATPASSSWRLAPARGGLALAIDF